MIDSFQTLQKHKRNFNATPLGRMNLGPVLDGEILSISPSVDGDLSVGHGCCSSLMLNLWYVIIHVLCLLTPPVRLKDLMTPRLLDWLQIVSVWNG